MLFCFVLTVPRVECHDNAAVPRARRCRTCLRVGTQVTGSRTDAVPCQKALSRGNSSGRQDCRVTVSKVSVGRTRPNSKSHEIAKSPLLQIALGYTDKCVCKFLDSIKKNVMVNQLLYKTSPSYSKKKYI